MNKKLLHLYWFAPDNLESASTRYRGYYPIHLLRDKYEVNSDFIFPTRNIKGILKFIRVYLAALSKRKKNSVIVIQKVCSNRIYANLLKILVSVHSKNTLYDLDDAEYLRQDTKTLEFFLRKCNMITVGSDALKDYCEDFNNNVMVLTSPVIVHNQKKSKRNEIPNIGWVGDMGHGNNVSKDFSHKASMFNILFPQIRQIERPITLTLIGVKNQNDIPLILDYFQNNSNIQINILQNLDWENDEWLYSEIAKFDVGVAPLTNHLFNISKSAFKAKQYLSVGVPTVASNIGENNKFVKHGINGFLCNVDEDFITSIEKITDMTDQEYFKLSANALNSHEDYSIKTYCELLIRICETRFTKIW